MRRMRECEEMLKGVRGMGGGVGCERMRKSAGKKKREERGREREKRGEYESTGEIGWESENKSRTMI